VCIIFEFVFRTVLKCKYMTREPPHDSVGRESNGREFMQRLLRIVMACVDLVIL